MAITRAAVESPSVSPEVPVFATFHVVSLLVPIDRQPPALSLRLEKGHRMWIRQNHYKVVGTVQKATLCSSVGVRRARTRRSPAGWSVSLRLLISYSMKLIHLICVCACGCVWPPPVNHRSLVYRDRLRPAPPHRPCHSLSVLPSPIFLPSNSSPIHPPPHGCRLILRRPLSSLFLLSLLPLTPPICPRYLPNNILSLRVSISSPPPTLFHKETVISGPRGAYLSCPRIRH